MKTILIVDDDWSIAETLTGVLEDEGFQCVAAANGQQGLDRLEESHPDLVLLDVMMPVVDGREMLRRMKAQPATAEIPVILMSAASGVSQKKQLGYTAFLQKPFSLDALLDLVERVLFEEDHSQPRPSR